MEGIPLWTAWVYEAKSGRQLVSAVIVLDVPAASVADISPADNDLGPIKAVI